MIPAAAPDERRSLLLRRDRTDLCCFAGPGSDPVCYVRLPDGGRCTPPPEPMVPWTAVMIGRRTAMGLRSKWTFLGGFAATPQRSPPQRRQDCRSHLIVLRLHH